jgi:RND superfamily putative drug exporter
MLLQLPQMIATMESTRTMMLTMHSTMGGLVDTQMEAVTNPMAMGNAFDESKNEDSFFMSQDIIDNNAAFQQIKKIFMSPDGKAARFLITQNVDPATPAGISRVEPIQNAAVEALKGTPLESAKLYLSGTAAGTKELVEGSKYDLLIAGVAALCLIFIIMLLITRSLIAALVIVGTVALSLGASFGLSVLVWQYLLGIQLNWVVLAMSVILLLAVGSDYNLLLVSRMKEELPAGIKTGIIRANGPARSSRQRVWCSPRRWGRWSSATFSPSVSWGRRSRSVCCSTRCCPRVHDTVDRRDAGALVLVAATRAPPSGQHHAPAARRVHWSVPCC